jgi:hypothetical protein
LSRSKSSWCIQVCAGLGIDADARFDQIVASYIASRAYT